MPTFSNNILLEQKNYTKIRQNVRCVKFPINDKKYKIMRVMFFPQLSYIFKGNALEVESFFSGSEKFFKPSTITKTILKNRLSHISLKINLCGNGMLFPNFLRVGQRLKPVLFSLTNRPISDLHLPDKKTAYCKFRS